MRIYINFLPSRQVRNFSKNEKSSVPARLEKQIHFFLILALELEAKHG